MEAREFRAAFSSFAGLDRYRHFIRSLNRTCRWRGRFLFWQEELLARFATSTQIQEVAFEQVEPLLRVCEHHGTELTSDPEGLSQRCPGAVTDFPRIRGDLFPNTDCGPMVMGRRCDNFRRGLWYCPACWAAEIEWSTKQARPSTAPDQQSTLPESLVELCKLTDVLDPYQQAISSKLGDYVEGCGTPSPLAEKEETFDRVWYYWQAAIINAADMFGYIYFIIEHEAHFKAIGATRTLEAMHQLMPYYEEQQKLKTSEERREFWHRTKHLRAPIEVNAEDMLDFGQLLLTFAEKNLEYLKHQG